MGKTDQRLRKRREKILRILPVDPNKGKTYEEIASKTEYSKSTIRTDLAALRGEERVGCDDSRVPFKWFKLTKSKKENS